MKTRVIVAVVLLPLLLAVLLVPAALPTAILLGAMCVLAVYELLFATGLVRHMRLVLYAMLAAIAVSVWSYLGCPAAFARVGIALYIIVLAGELLAAHTELDFSSVCISVFAGLLVPLLLTALIRIRIMESGVYLILLPFTIAFSADSGAYFAGRAFGKHKLAPVISPKKTVEGAIGGILSAIVMVCLYGLVLQLAFDFKVNYGFGILYAAVGAAVSIVGDLMFSVIKRKVNIKDYGKLLPGHGGILDRFDSMTLVAPVVEAFLLLLPFAARV